MPKSSSAPSARNGRIDKLEDKFVLRLPKEYHEQLAAISRRNRRSMNSEITLLLEQFVASEGAVVADRVGLSPAQSTLDASAMKLIEKFQNLSLEKQQALLDLLD